MASLLTLFRPKPIEDLDDHPDQDGHGTGYKKVLGALDLTLLGIGCIIGAGIFTLTGITARDMAGPAVVLSYVLAGLVCAFSALCYSEMAAMIPISGSAYSYAYATCGELLAWIIGWDLCLEYLVGAAAVANGWSAYLNKWISLASGETYHFDPKWSSAPVIWNTDSQAFEVTGNYLDLPALIGTSLMTILLAVGVKQSAWVVHVMVIVKIIVIIMFLLGGIKYADGSKMQPFMPFGFDGVFKGAIVVFFAYIGFDAVSTCAQEAKNPQRDMPIGIIGSLTICTVLYICVCVMLCSLVPYSEIEGRSPVASAFVTAGGPAWIGTILAFGAWCGLTSVLMVTLIGQPRIFRAMAFDGLFPNVFAYIHPKTGTPITTTLISGFFAAVLAAVFPIDVLAELSSVGTLFAFFLVSAAVIILRFQQPDRHRPYRIPGGKIGGIVFPLISMALIIVLLWKGGTTATVARVFIWMAIGLIVYFSYGFWWSKLRHPQKWPATTSAPAVVAVPEFDVKEKKDSEA
ncbi:Cationic amino acid transporter-1 [Phlyctochytrium planicorne]|nr:Cationic amino acid transporter-1 [Phlyctochytrium planicorne]